ncbi:MAG: DEAD/DEAH box helicase [Phycisphaeraceae bacterium]
MTGLLQQPAAPREPALPPSQWWRTLSTDRRPAELPRHLDAAWDAVAARLVPWVPRRTRFLRRAQRILAMSDALDTVQLHDEAMALRARFRLGRANHADVDRAFALVRAAAHRHLGLKAYREQVAAALAMHAGCLAEVATGEGKTLAATLPAVVAGWRGRGCHVITVNDYLAQRDAEWMRPVYEACGLSVACITADMAAPQRRAAYAADITYGTNKEVTADFLRDTLAMGRQSSLPRMILRRTVEWDEMTPQRVVMRGLACAIVDEADSVLIDEAVTPLIISGEAPNAAQAEAHRYAAALAEPLQVKRDYRVDHRHREVRLTPAGRMHLAELAADAPGLWHGPRRREELVVQALTARELFHRGQHYVVQGEDVVIVDEFTGRLMPDRTWRDGLHQAVEAKEGLPIKPAKVTLARLSFQQFFRRYQHLCGMTGTAWEARHELWRVYRTPVVRIPTHRPCIRRQQRDRLFETDAAKWQAVVAEIERVHQAGRPVLVGTRSVEASERLSAMLHERGLAHQVLNAVRHEEEAAIIAQAGRAGRITVATNMAGRGTDIRLDREVAERGGLHVIGTERHTARRVDRQLAGRAARQGEPGSAVAIVSLEDELLRRHAPRAAAMVRRTGMTSVARVVFRLAQRRAERRAREQRRAVLKRDDWLHENLGFARGE